MNMEEHLGKNLLPGADHYRAFVGPPQKYDLASAMQFNLMTGLGLREDHILLDVGCGSLRVGRLFIPYLLTGNYYGIEPEKWLVEQGIDNELGNDILTVKRPNFAYDTNFTLSVFDQKFDFIIAQSIFSHTSPKQIRRCLSEAKKTMKRNAIFAATFLLGEENYSGDEWVYPDSIPYTMDYMKDLAVENDLVCVPIEWWHPNRQTWVTFVHPENQDNIANLADPMRNVILQDKLTNLQTRFAKLESHPYVKIGLKTNALMRRLIRKVRSG